MPQGDSGAVLFHNVSMKVNGWGRAGLPQLRRGLLQTMIYQQVCRPQTAGKEM